MTSYVNIYYPDDAAVVNDAQLSIFWDGDAFTDHLVGLTRGHVGLHVNDPDVRFPQLSGKAVLIEVLSTYITIVTGIHNQVT